MDGANGSSSSSLSPRKRRRVDDVAGAANHDSDTDQTLSLGSSLTFSDTLVALRIMRAQFPRIDKVKVSIQPFILRSQLYSSVKDRTQVDRELESLRREKVLRIFKLSTGQDDHAIMFIDDYLAQIELAVKRVEARKQDALAVFECFRTHVIISKLEPNIGHQELLSLLSLGGKVKDEHISLLINAGLLTRQLIDPNMYWFSIPSIGSVLKGLSQTPCPHYLFPHRNTILSGGCHNPIKSLQAMQAELEAMESNHTWMVTTLSPDKHTVGCKWTYKIKYDSEGYNTTHRQRLYPTSWVRFLQYLCPCG